jgi:hypothetical protein
MNQWRDRLGPWLLPVIAGCALLLSASALYLLMVRFGWHWSQALALPVCVDVFAVYGVYLWLANKQASPAMRFGRKIAISALVVSLAGNWLEHGLAAPGGWYWIGGVCFGSIPPVALFVGVHAYSLTKKVQTDPKPKPVTEPAQDRPVPVRNPTPRRTVTPRKTTETTKALPNPHPAAVQRFKELTARDGKAPSRRVFTELARGEGWPTTTLHHQSVIAAALAEQNGHAG